jgi:16S rRNA G527 N7-methylase RsmG
MQIINKLLRLVLPEHKIWELKNKNNIPSMEWSLLNIKKQGFNPRFTIDVGAFDGEWSVMFKKLFPDTKILMVEAQESKKEHLQSVANSLADAKLHIALLGAEKAKR